MNTKSYPLRREQHRLVIGLLAIAPPRRAESEKCEHGTPLIELSNKWATHASVRLRF